MINILATYIGCYNNFRGDISQSVLTKFSRSDVNGPIACATANTLYFGLENRTTCLFGDKLENLDKRQMLDDSECEVFRCPGDESQWCGGRYTARVFKRIWPGGLKNWRILFHGFYKIGWCHWARADRLLAILQPKYATISTIFGKVHSEKFPVQGSTTRLPKRPNRIEPIMQHHAGNHYNQNAVNV